MADCDYNLDRQRLREVRTTRPRGTIRSDQKPRQQSSELNPLRNAIQRGSICLELCLKRQSLRITGFPLSKVNNGDTHLVLCKEPRLSSLLSWAFARVSVNPKRTVVGF